MEKKMVETLKSKEAALPPVEIVETDHENIKLSRDQFEEKYRKKRELKARLELEKIRIEKELETEGSEDNKAEDKNEEV